MRDVLDDTGVIDLLARYGEAVETATVATLPAGAPRSPLALLSPAAADSDPQTGPAGDPVPISEEEGRSAGAEPARRGRSRQLPWLAVAAAVAVVALVAGVLAMGEDDGADKVSTTTPDPTVTTREGDSSSPTFGYTPGWHELDTGPLSARTGAAVTWTGEELIVLGGVDVDGEPVADGAAYDPIERTWRSIAESPLPAGKSQATWTGDELVAISDPGIPADAGPDCCDPRVAAAYDPTANSWRSLPAAPPPAETRYGTRLYWLDGRIVLTSPLATLDPEAEAWETAGDQDPAYRMASASDGDRVVFADYLGGGIASTFDPESGAVDELPSPPAPAVTETYSGTVAATPNGRAVLADCGGNAAVLDLEDEEWEDQPIAAHGPAVCIPQSYVLGGLPVVDLGTAVYALDGDEWREVPIPDCCKQVTSTGDVLFQWWGDPEATFRVWVPADDLFSGESQEGDRGDGEAEDPSLLPTTTLAAPTTGPPATAAPPPASPTPTTPPGPPPVEHPGPTFGYGRGWHDLTEGPLDPRANSAIAWTGDELVVLGGDGHHDGAAYDPSTRVWRTIATPPLADGTPKVIVVGGELIAIEDAGGAAASGRSSRRVEAWNPATDSWRTLASAPMPDYPKISGILWTGEEIFLGDDLVRYRPSNNTWTEMPRPPNGQPFAVDVGVRPMAISWTGENPPFIGEIFWLAGNGTRSWWYADRIGGWAPTDGPWPAANADARVTAWYDTVEQRVHLESAGGWSQSQEFTESYWGSVSHFAPSPAGCQPQAVFVDGRAFVDRCDRVESASGGEVAGFDTWVGNARLASTGETLIEWRSTGTEAELRLWVP